MLQRSSMSCTLITSCLILVVHALPAQTLAPLPMKWGKIPVEQLKMKVYDADTNASALVLCQYGSLEETGSGWVLKIHKRIKILSTEGIEKYGTQTISYIKPKQDVDDIEAVTYLLNESGKIETHELSGDDLFREVVNQNGKEMRVRFAFPKITVGAVIEYRCEKKYSYLPMLLWNFQEDVPILWSEFRIAIPNGLDIISMKRGFKSFDILEKTPYFALGYNGSIYRYVMKNVPAVRDEPYMMPKSDIISSISFKLLGLAGDRSSEDWKFFIDVYSHLFKDLVGDTLRFKKIANSIVGDTLSDEEKVFQIASYAQKKFKALKLINSDQNGSDDFPITDSTSVNVFNINLSLVETLKSIGIESYPIMVSNRSNGLVQKMNPRFLNGFDRVMVYAKANKKEFIIDASDTLRPFDLLPLESLNSEGLLVKQSLPERWIPLTPSKKFKRTYKLDFTSLSDTNIVGILKINDEDYRAFLTRKKIIKETASEYIKSIMRDYASDYKYDTFSVKNMNDITKPLNIIILFYQENESLGNSFIYINPTQVGRLQKNPFVQQTRIYPIDMVYPIEENFNFKMPIPEGYVVKNFPPSIYFSHSDGKSAEFKRESFNHKDYIEINTRFLINRTKYMSGEYEDLKKFYDNIIACESEQIILERVQSPERKIETIPQKKITKPKKK